MTEPVLGALRLAWIAAVAAARDAEGEALGAVQTALAQMRPSATRTAQLVSREAWKLERAEIAASRAFLATLQATDPCCSICGCSQLDGCAPPCWWISVDPWVCSSHREAMG